MKALTVKQPWAGLIIEGYKKYEFRSWKTNYRGKILIHAGLSFDKDRLDQVKNYNLIYKTGTIIGEADLVDCILVDEQMDNNLRKINPIIYVKNHVGKYAWKLENKKNIVILYLLKENLDYGIIKFKKKEGFVKKNV